MSYPTYVRCHSCTVVERGEVEIDQALFQVKRDLRASLASKCNRHPDIPCPMKDAPPRIPSVRDFERA